MVTTSGFENLSPLECNLHSFYRPHWLGNQSITSKGIPEGVTLLTGGEFHGRSTWLEAIEIGIYNHLPGDWLSVSCSITTMDSYIPHIITNWTKPVIDDSPAILPKDLLYGALADRQVKLASSGLSKSPYMTRRNFTRLRPQNQTPMNDPSEAEPGVDLSGLDQLVEARQARLIALLLDNIPDGMMEQP